MRKGMTAVAVLAAAALLTTVASARSVSAKQRVTFMNKAGSFVLTPLSSGAIKTDKGALDACCWTTRHVVVAGQRLDVNDPHLTLTGRNGTLKLRNRIAWVDLPDGWAIFTGTWKVVGGTGAYAGVSGEGVVRGVSTANGGGKSTFLGFLTSS